MPPPEVPLTAFPPADSSCTARYTTEGESPREITRYQHTCNPPATSAVQHTLKLNFTHDKDETAFGSYCDAGEWVMNRPGRG